MECSAAFLKKKCIRAPELRQNAYSRPFRLRLAQRHSGGAPSGARIATSPSTLPPIGWGWLEKVPAKTAPASTSHGQKNRPCRDRQVPEIPREDRRRHIASRPFQHYRTARRLSPAARSSEPCWRRRSGCRHPPPRRPAATYSSMSLEPPPTFRGSRAPLYFVRSSQPKSRASRFAASK